KKVPTSYQTASSTSQYIYRTFLHRQLTIPYEENSHGAGVYMGSHSGRKDSGGRELPPGCVDLARNVFERAMHRECITLRFGRAWRFQHPKRYRLCRDL